MSITFRRYTTIKGYPCRRIGPSTIVWDDIDDNTVRASVFAPGSTTPSQIAYSTPGADLLSETKNIMSCSAPHKEIAHSILEGDVAACKGCTRCLDDVIIRTDKDVTFIAIPARPQGYMGRATITCANPEVYFEDAITWEFSFFIPRTYDRRCLFFKMIKNYGLPHPHCRDGGGMACMDYDIRGIAHTMFAAGEPATAIRVMLEAMRTITPNDVSDSTLRINLGLNFCYGCSELLRDEDLEHCVYCSTSVCASCLTEKNIRDGKFICNYCAGHTYSVDPDDYTWEDDATVDIGSVVMLGRHDNGENFATHMEEFVGRVTQIDSFNGTDMHGFALACVHADRACWSWRIANMKVGTLRKTKRRRK